MNKIVGVVDCGMGNIGSVLHSLRLVGLNGVRVVEAGQLAGIGRLLLPGVGSFPTFVSRLQSTGLGPAIVDYAMSKSNRLIGICVGMQALLTVGTEGGGARGLNLVKGRVVQFDPNVVSRVPHVGWNYVNFAPNELFDQCGQYYFTHSYHCELDSNSDVIASTYNGVNFVSAFRKDNIFGFQFHPEKSGEIGSKLLHNFLMGDV